MFGLINGLGEFVGNDFYADAAAAKTAADEVAKITGRKYRIRLVADDSWRNRARHHPFYRNNPLPEWWRLADWWVDSMPLRDHYAYIAPENNDSINYIESPEHGMLGRYTTVPISRYLGRFFGDKLTGDQIRDITSRISGDKVELNFSTDSDDFEDIFVQSVCAQYSRSTSCMSQPKTNFDSGHHPARAYASGDFAICWTGEKENVLARTVVDIKNKEYVRLYGQSDRDCLHLQEKLNANGYVRVSSYRENLKLNAFYRYGKLEMPYIDGERQNVDTFADSAFISHYGEYSAEGTDGYVYEREDDDYNDDDNY